jgi:hypothetical protein
MKTSGAFWRSIGLAGVVMACAGACGGSGESAPSYTPVSATNDGELYTLALGDLKMVIDAAKGARITEFSLAGTNVLIDADVGGANYGSTFWVSPQSSWCAAGGGCWPPLAAIDTKPYTGGIDSNPTAITLTSGEATIGQFVGSAITLNKRFVPVPGSGAIDVAYALTNTSATVSVSVAPWQISRVAAGGLTYFGQGTGAVTYAADSDPAFAVTETAGARWYESGPVTHNSKALADSTGWLAHVTPDRLLYLQSYPDIQPADAAPGEAEVEIFTNGDYVELEPQGALTTVPPGGTLAWTVRWKLRRVPGGTTLESGSPGLTSLASATLAE